ncbi:MAG: bifunctional chorismate mutase/prephenate dehydratase [Kiritimatiellia bacterium]
MKDPKELNAEIDALDRRLVPLLAERLKLADEAAEERRAAGLPASDPAREREILTALSGRVDADCARAVRLVYTTLFGAAKARQRVRFGTPVPLLAKLDGADSGGLPPLAVVACAGTEGSYAQEAASRFFEVPSILYFNGFEKVFEAVEEGVCPYGVLPIENSAAGSVASIYDLMQRHRFSIVRALKLKIRHVLLGNPGATLGSVREVASHPHALAQCSAFLKAHPAWRAEPESNTAVAARALAASGRTDRAVIASRACAGLYGLRALAEDVSDTTANFTRFICIAREPRVAAGASKICLMLSLPHRPGSLSGIIAKFASAGVNLTKLESRPEVGTDFEFRFIFEFEASVADPDVRALLAELASDPEIEHFTFLGAFEEL